MRVLGRPLRRLTVPRSPLRCAAAVNERMLGDGGLLEAEVVGRESILLELGSSQIAQCGPLDEYNALSTDLHTHSPKRVPESVLNCEQLP